MRKRLSHNKLTLMAVNPYKGKGSYVLRILLEDPKRAWTGTELSKELRMSSAWVNRIIGTLEFDKLVQRSGAGPNDTFKLIHPKKLISRWAEQYHIHHNTLHHYLIIKGDPLKILAGQAKTLKYDYAVTGYTAANTISKTVMNAIPMVYLWPESDQEEDFNPILTKLENIHHFIPVKKGANLIVIKPRQKETALFHSEIKKGLRYVSPVQLYLDLKAMDRGDFAIKELKSCWQQRKMDYVL